ncbi:hypothetical protein H3T72_gp02 [Enterococcus phage vB_EfaP_Ef7.3]|uniref:Uncharacterized protein n=1 Tax=Enterococcus phage vB_EfaP_Ef7.3 TaxID=2546619 RepID=A0A4D6DRU0_9CAUD|nr:hypothetical protein H3T72_gp02 [Enterococcus phage vB_EfaP_Ef7.3]QBZ69053.1 hypothetical protein [Enterococcus phage vB_EfaP_Ef7.3]
MKYNKGELQAGMKLKCFSTTKKNWWEVGKTYKIKKHDNGLIYITDETGYNWHEDAILDFLSKKELFNAKLEIVKEENKMQEFKVGDLVEVLENKSWAIKDKFNLFEKGDRAIIKEVNNYDVRIGEYGIANLISKKEIKKVEPKSELTEYEEEIVLRLADKIKQKDEYIKELEYLDSKVKDIEILLEDKQKEIDFEVKKLLTK